tara:strand:- start:530 stop:907 length:378 start_codon:yes stop_codon:yes gene_type:complete
MNVAAFRAEIREALEGVSEQMNYIEVSGAFDHGGNEPRKRIVVSLPYSVFYLARFLALMEAELMPASLKLWDYANNSRYKNPSLQTRLDRQARRYLETRIERFLFDELNRLHARASESARRPTRG